MLLKRTGHRAVLARGIAVRRSVSQYAVGVGRCSHPKQRIVMAMFSTVMSEVQVLSDPRL